MDVATDQGIAGPETSNAPFMDRRAAARQGRQAWSPEQLCLYCQRASARLPPSGTKVRGIIVLCTAPNQSGQCVEMKVTFVFP